MQEVNRLYRHFRPNEWSPRQSIIVGVTLGFFVFLGLDMLENFYFKQEAFLRLLHFARGFFATAGGMVFVWWIMQRKEQELKLLRDHFRIQLQERTLQLKTQTEDNEQQKRDFQSTLLQQREDFLAVINHRLRTPVLANTRTAQLLLDGVFGPLTEEQIKVAKALLESNYEINRLLAMLIDLYRYKNSNSELSFKTQSLESILQQVADLKLKASEKNLLLDIQVPPDITVTADAKELAKLFLHLIENAIKFARSRVSLTGKIIAEAKQLAVSIEDDGAGIAKEDLPHIFDRFYLLSSQGKYSAMTGIGLCLCSEIIRAHNGQIKCESQPGQGTKFTVLLPHSAESK